MHNLRLNYDIKRWVLFSGCSLLFFSWAVNPSSCVLRRAQTAERERVKFYNLNEFAGGFVCVRERMLPIAWITAHIHRSCHCFIQALQMHF